MDHNCLHGWVTTLGYDFHVGFLLYIIIYSYVQEVQHNIDKLKTNTYKYSVYKGNKWKQGTKIHTP